MTSPTSKRTRWILAAIAIFVGTLFLRLLLIGGPPCGGEGFYALHAELAARGAGVLPHAPLNLYSSLLSLVVTPRSTPLWRFRLVDAFVAAGSAVMMFGFLGRWVSRLVAFVMASAWSLAVNLPIFVEMGFCNPIAAATLVYLAALWCLSTASRTALFWAGLLMTLAVGLREPFVLTTVVSVYLALALHGRRALLVHLAGLALGGGLFLLWICVYRGSPLVMLEYYRELAMFYDGITKWFGPKDRDWALLISTRATMWLFPSAAVGLLWVVWPRSEPRAAKGLAILLFLVHFPEIFGKFCLAYHWGQLLVGIVFLGAMGLNWLMMSDPGLNRNLNRNRVFDRARDPDRNPNPDPIRPLSIPSPTAAWLKPAAILALAASAGELDARSVYQSYRDGLKLARRYAPVMLRGNWDDPCVSESIYLQAAKFVKEHSSADDRIIAGFAGWPLYVLSGRMPPSEFAVNLEAMSFKQYSRRRPEVLVALRQRPPRLVFAFIRWETDMHEFWPDFERRYRLVRTFPQNKVQHQPYGEWGAWVWELNE